MMKLYYHPISAYSQKTVVGLHEKGVAFTPEIVDITSPDALAAFKKLTPLGKVPLLVLDDGYKIPESSIILEYVDQHVAGGNRLIPTDPDLARRTRFHDRLADLYLTNPFLTIFFDGRKPAADRNPAAVASASATLDTMYQTMDAAFEKKTWVLGDTFTMADCAHVAPLAALRMVKPYDSYKHLTAYAGRLAERPSVRKVAEEAAPYIAKMMGKG